MTQDNEFSTYNDIDCTESSDGPISSQVGISKKGSKQWCDIASSRPIRHTGWRFRIRLV